MDFRTSIRTCLSKFATFSGRAPRSEYWWFLLFVVLVSFVASVLDQAMFGVDPETGEPGGAFAGIWQLAMFLPLLSAGWRRLQDTGRPGWYLLIPMLISLAFMISVFLGVMSYGAIEQGVPDPDTLRAPAAAFGLATIVAFSIAQLVASILMLWWLTRPSEPGANAYGPAPATTPAQT
ncbi:uncharacterized membrane protein YhaH (DUF805 family) [Aliiruegeria haliotis]|uniref:Uncharacterized membrane protein YhaH (DUF805 family) n=1 Tax=Aliiruegeria haliotis TaxID=1280846 RepID=A0A2T0RYC1_9RHOB|nr:DUF805 domain-containing protein [Aliiruegeria haliotis]PRY26179.1 uncharacterized membrane protein YhaH (DUF805 family) [Aliiruegeria haliotis]